MADVAPPTPPAPYRDPRVVGTLVLGMRLRRSGVAGTSIKVTDTLPWPSRLTEISYIPVGGALTSGSPSLNILLSEDDDTGAGAATPGLSLGRSRLVGTSPPDAVNDQNDAFTATNQTTQMRFPIFVPVPKGSMRLKFLLTTTAAVDSTWHVWVTLALLDRPDQVGSEGIIPRGTLEDPVCVRVCGPTPTPSPGPVPTPAPPPAPPVPQPTRGDPLAEPLPPPSEIDPDNPLSYALARCAIK